MIDAVATHAQRQPDALACADLDGDGVWTWAELDADINRTAHWLVAELGAASGARVATLAKNATAMLILQLACARAGAIFVPLNWRLAPTEVAGLIDDAAPALLFCGAEFEVQATAYKVHRLDALPDLMAGQPATPPDARARPDWADASTILYTSGTSGRPKGVMISEANAFWGASNFINGYGVTNSDAVLCDMPLFHTAGLFAAARGALLAGATLYISRGFDPEKTLARIANPQHGITVYFSVPQMAQMLWNQPHFHLDMLRRLRVYATGGAPNPAAQIARFVAAGIPMSDGFGMTETGSNFGMPVRDRAKLVEKAGSIGQPFLAVQAKVVDRDGHAVPSGTPGELWVRGPSITRGYWQQPKLTAGAFEGGWFKTGDICVCDADGFYFIVDRKKDMFISGGENVYPAEIEAAIAELPEIAEAAVIGVVDEQWGEVGYAYVVPVKGTKLTPETVRDHCLMRLAKFKVPKSVIITDTLPRSATGKILKNNIRESDAWMTPVS
jgi:fatty-acyl-CoA synthase